MSKDLQDQQEEGQAYSSSKDVFNKGREGDQGHIERDGKRQPFHNQTFSGNLEQNQIKFVTRSQIGDSTRLHFDRTDFNQDVNNKNSKDQNLLSD